MRVFVTGGSGFIGSAVIERLRAQGHQVLALARSRTSAATLRGLGAQVHEGSLENNESLARGARACDGVIHLGFVHDFTRFAEMCQLDRRVVETLGNALRGTDRPLIITSGAALVSPGRLATEEDSLCATADQFPRAATEQAALALVQQGVRAALVRLSPSVHGPGDHGFIPILGEIARQQGTSAYLGEGANRWNAVHRLDAARVFVGALERATPGARYHAVAEQEIAFRTIAEAIGQRLGLPARSLAPAEADAHFGWFRHFAELDCPVSSALTQSRLAWEPSQPTLLDELASTAYFA